MSTITQEAKQEETAARIVDRGEATAKLITPGGKVVTIIGVEEVRNAFEKGCLDQITNIAEAPGIDETVLNPDGHVGYGCPVGSVFSSREMIYPNAVGPDVSCSMSFLQMDLPADALDDNKLGRAVIDALEERIPMGPGSHVGKKARQFDSNTLWELATSGATKEVLSEMGIPLDWSQRCEDATHGDRDKLSSRLEEVSKTAPHILEKLKQIGGVGGGNHFMECNVVKVNPGMEEIANTFGLVNGKIGFLNHFGSRGFGFMLTEGGRGWPGQFRLLAERFNKWRIGFPGGDAHNVYAPLGTPECDDYLTDMYLGANFATVNHLLVCSYVLDAFQEVLGKSVTGEFVYHIAHNIIRYEVVDKAPAWVHRKGATKAFPAGHHELKNTPFYASGHPILLPGNPIEGSTIMVGRRGSRKALNSVNHGAGRRLSRKKAKEAFKQRDVNASFDAAGILTNCRQYPLDESAGSYKEYEPVIRSVELAGLASTVATLKPRLLLKDSDQSRETSA